MWLWRAAPPKAGPERPVHLPTPVTFTLDNGLRVILAPGTSMPIVSANLVVRTGGDANPIDRPGLASLTSALLTQGTATRTALQIANDAAQLGASLGATSTKDASTASIQSLRKNFAGALDLLADVALHPTFPPAELERQRTSRLADLVQAQDDPNTVASRAALAALYGPMHADGRLSNSVQPRP